MQKVMIKMDTQSLPMFVPPRPWVAANDGCYLATPGECTELIIINTLHVHTHIHTHTHTHIPLILLHTGHIMRVGKDVYQHQLLLDQTKNLNPVLDALNFLGSTPWKINKRVR